MKIKKMNELMSEPMDTSPEALGRIIGRILNYEKLTDKRIGVMEGLLYALGQLEWGMVYSNSMIIKEARKYAERYNQDGF